MDEDNPACDSERLAHNLARIEALSARVAAALAEKHAIRPSLQGPGTELYLKAANALAATMMADPGRLWSQQIAYWSKTLEHAAEAQAALASEGAGGVPEDKGAPDRRFSNPLWDSNPWFNFVKQQYQINSAAARAALGDLDGLSKHDRKRVAYFTQQMLDMFAPTNFLATNPDALERALETEGQSLVDGLENMARDLEANQGELLPTLSDPDAFEVGRNLATSDGEVVFRNRLFELIQYAPRSDKVHATPLIIFPPWINKFYVLDLRPQNSLLRWLSEQGFTVFVVSWVNPDASYADVGVDTYIEEGFLSAINEVKALCGVRKVNAVGYCIGGTTLALTLALMSKRGDDSVKAASFFTTLTDFSDPGEVGVFLDEDFLGGLDAEVAEKGILPHLYMARTFSFLRANNLLYGPSIRAYLLGEPPPAFDLLYWNADGTNLPARMAMEYLRGLCDRDEFANGGYRVLGETVSIGDVQVPLYAVACETDHIAPWKSSYGGIRRMGSADKTFILAESGHIAGIINPPSKNKYGHYSNASWPADPAEWLDGATFHDGSWWGRWGKWLSTHSGRKVAARKPVSRDGTSLGPAPGSYVMRSSDG